MTRRSVPSVEEIIKIFGTNNTSAKLTFLENCLSSFAMATAKQNILQPYLEINLAGLNLLAETYSRGIDCDLGATLGQAIFCIAQQAFSENKNDEYLHKSYLYCAGCGAISWVIGLNNLGRYENSVQIVGEVINWLKLKPYKENQEHQNMLRIHLIEAYIGLAHVGHHGQNELLDKTNELLTQTQTQTHWRSLDWAYQSTLSGLQQKYDQLVQPVIIIPNEPDETKAMEQAHSNLDGLKKGGEALDATSPELANHFKTMVHKLEVFNQLPLPETQAKRAIEIQPIANELADFLSGSNPNEDSITETNS